MEPQILELRKKIESHLESSDDYNNKEFQWRMSAAGQCPRLMDYTIKHGAKPFDIQGIFRMERGQALHDRWQDTISDAIGEDFIDVEKELSIKLKSGREILGHIDGYIPSMDAIYELKTVADSTFIMIMNMGTPISQHYEQGNLYAHSYGAKNILFHYYNSNSGESTYMLSPFSDALALETMAKFEQRELHIESGCIAERPHHDPTCSPCWYCSYKDKCYEGWGDEVKGMGSTEMDSMELSVSAGLAIRSQKQRLSSDKEEKKHKAELVRVMLSEMKINKAVLKGHTINIKLGTKGNPLVTVKERKSE